MVITAGLCDGENCGLCRKQIGIQHSMEPLNRLSKLNPVNDCVSREIRGAQKFSVQFYPK